MKGVDSLQQGPSKQILKIGTGNRPEKPGNLHQWITGFLLLWPFHAEVNVRQQVQPFAAHAARVVGVLTQLHINMRRQYRRDANGAGPECVKHKCRRSRYPAHHPELQHGVPNPVSHRMVVLVMYMPLFDVLQPCKSDKLRLTDIEICHEPSS